MEGDTLAQLEERILRAADVVSRLKKEKDTALAAAMQTESLHERIAQLHKDLEATRAERDTLRAEREQVRRRIEKLLEQIDHLGAV